MIVSASRRTDIPALYADWFCNRLKEGFVLIPNPRNPQRLGRVELSPRNVDCIVFWTKNPAPMFGRLKEIERLGYPFIVQFTLTAYDATIERGLPPKKAIIESFIELAGRIGPDRVVWRYDPILVDHRFSAEWHTRQFASLCERLASHTHRCIVSFVDPYKSLAGQFRSVEQEEMFEVAQALSHTARQYGLGLTTCAEEVDLSPYGVEHGACVDARHIEQILGSRLHIKADANQRPMCLCAEAVDVGAYDTCTHGCAYCYAVSSPKALARNRAAHDPVAPMLTGFPTGAEMVTDRTRGSHKILQRSLFE